MTVRKLSLDDSLDLLRAKKHQQDYSFLARRLLAHQDKLEDAIDKKLTDYESKLSDVSGQIATQAQGLTANCQAIDTLQKSHAQMQSAATTTATELRSEYRSLIEASNLQQDSRYTLLTQSIQTLTSSVKESLQRLEHVRPVAGEVQLLSDALHAKAACSELENASIDHASAPNGQVKTRRKPNAVAQPRVTKGKRAVKSIR